jgi:ribosomal protein L7/L12
VGIIKAVRQATGSGLKEAKDLVDRAKTVPTAIKAVDPERLLALHRELELLECGIRMLTPDEAIVYGVMSV